MAIDLLDTVGAARQSARRSFPITGVRLTFGISRNGMYVVTSPDADWLVVTARSQKVARDKAITALLRVARWSGADLNVAGGRSPG